MNADKDENKDKPRLVPIHQSMHRPEISMGAEREPVLCLALVCFITIASSIAYGHLFIGFMTTIVYALGIYLLRKMAKADSIMTKVWRRRITYQEYYSARTPIWNKSGYFK